MGSLPKNWRFAPNFCPYVLLETYGHLYRFTAVKRKKLQDRNKFYLDFRERKRLLRGK